ncbi:hypothetical protein BDN71DRAFT_1499587 [Pleurotus eryngii]|uniref:CxC2-like cysteine cluster KDZ transposase-associated domain-containing protein n=1 Tax=Pleurotus eryngii TaxID=5323 RepID=A0A9P6D239_PLEER|nr:hypothetical protein BDN71DRAFT_1499587 [Pleurotus eryngii]
MGIEFTMEKNAFIKEHWAEYGKSNCLRTRERFLDSFFAAWLTHFHETEYLEADASIQVFVKCHMIMFKAILEEKTTPEDWAKLTAPWRGIKLEIRKATVKVEKGPRRFNPFRASMDPGALGMKITEEQMFKIRTKNTMPLSILDSMPSSISAPRARRLPAENHKPRKKPQLHVHEPEKWMFVATTTTATRLHHSYINAPLPSAAVTEDVISQPSTSFEFALGNPIKVFTDPNPQPIDVINVMPTDGSGLVVKTKAKRYVNLDTPLLTWKLQYRQHYLDAALLLDGHGRHNLQGCTSCQDPNPIYRCLDCHGYWMYYQKCIVEIHHSKPLHLLEKWTDNDFFEKCTLHDLGLRIQLGHPKTVSCPMVKRGHIDFVLIHTNGIHLVAVDFCGCPDKREHYDQILDVGWWPSSPLDPQTATMFQLLHLFHSLNLQGCIPATDFYRSLEQLNHGDGLVCLPDRLQQFMLTVREWRHIRMAKRGGRGNDPTGLNATKQGELAVPCQSCPHPGINLPQGWEREPPDTHWLYGLLLQEDANFKQKSRLRSTDGRDLALGPGWAIFVGGDTYFAHLSNYVDQEEKGECYVNIDYIFLSSIMATSLLLVMISYDIACQWFRNFFTRMDQLPFHLAAHKEICHALFSLNYTKWVGHTNGEGVEHMWSWLNKVAHSTSMMGYGGRQDMLDNFCNFWNWRKTVNLAELLEWESQVRAWELDQSKPCLFDLPHDDLRMADVKKAMAEEDHLREERGNGTYSDTSPSAFLISGMDIEETQQELRVAASKRDLTTVEATQLQTSRTNLLKRIKRFRETQPMYMSGLSNYLKQFPSDETTSTPELMPLYLPSFFPTAQQHLICQPNLNELEDRLRFAQTTEALSNLRCQLRTCSFANSYKTRNTHSQGAYTQSWLLQNQIEVRIRAIRGQYDNARAALLSLRGPGDWETSLRLLHAEDIRGINERALTAEEQEEYRHAQLLAGVSPESVQNELDGHGVTSGQENAPTVAFNRSLALGEGRQTLSWIWYTVTDEEILGAGEVQACLRVEWVKARARTDRWQEEVLLLEEEMRRAIAFCKWKAEYWDNAATTRCPDDINLREGIRAYTYRQAANERRRALQWKDKWQAIREHTRLVMNEQHGQIDDGLTVPPALIVELDLEDDVDTDEGDEI